jgi:hypothetical protein
MLCFYRAGTAKCLLILVALMASVANASLLECSKKTDLVVAANAECESTARTAAVGPITALKEAIPVAVATAPNGFPLNQTRSSDAIADSAPLLVLICSLLGIVLIRAKSYNGK